MSTKKEVKCKCCKNLFLARVADINRGWGKFCSKSCKAKNQERKTQAHQSFIQRRDKAIEKEWHPTYRGILINGRN